MHQTRKSDINHTGSTCAQLLASWNRSTRWSHRLEWPWQEKIPVRDSCGRTKPCVTTDAQGSRRRWEHSQFSTLSRLLSLMFSACPIAPRWLARCPLPYVILPIEFRWLLCLTKALQGSLLALSNCHHAQIMHHRSPLVWRNKIFRLDQTYDPPHSTIQTETAINFN